MKCPKCDYLGFETGDRCKNCGYNFSLMTSHDEISVLDLPLREASPLEETPLAADTWLTDLDSHLAPLTPERAMRDFDFDIDLGPATVPVPIETVPDAPLGALDLSQFDESPSQPVRTVAPFAEIGAATAVARVDRDFDSDLDSVVADASSSLEVAVAPAYAADTASAFVADATTVDGSVDRPAEEGEELVEQSTGVDAALLDSRAAARIDEAMAANVPTVVTSAPTAPTRFTPASLPLFTRNADDDTPLVRLPAAPRAPLSVRKTPENPRLRSVPRPIRQEPEPELVLQFDEAASTEVDAAPVATRPRQSSTGSSGARLMAVIIDNAILGSIDIAVLYFTLKVAALSLDDWQQIPLVPMVSFLLVMKLFYFAGFTAVGGQTIGKMGSGIRVIADDGSPLGVAGACRRSVASLLSLVTLGAGFLPALFGDEHRAIHDRVAGTRVVTA